LTHGPSTELASISDADEIFWAYFDPSSASSYILALDQLDAYLAAEGPFDGVLAFSQGAGLAAMHIVRKAIQAPLETPPFRFAILISCNAVYDPVAWLERGQVRTMDPDNDGQPIKIPTVHIWGEQDPLRNESETLSKLCEKSLTTVFVHEGGHEVPKLSAKDAVAKSVKAMRRGITEASFLGNA
jgi:pimeloyl-ACP methyl ester carboxylesterase